MTDPMLNTWTWTYDLLGHQTSATDPDTGLTTTTYDDDGQYSPRPTPTVTCLPTSMTTWDAKPPIPELAVRHGNTVGGLDLRHPGQRHTKTANRHSTSYTGSTPGHPGAAYTEAVTGYDANDRSLGMTYTLPASQGTLAATRTRGISATTPTAPQPAVRPRDGRAAREDLPPATPASATLQLRRPEQLPLPDDLRRPRTGHRASHYNSSKRLDDTYTYSNDGQNRLRHRHHRTAASTNNKIAGLTYSYDNAGNVLSEINTPAGQDLRHPVLRLRQPATVEPSVDPRPAEDAPVPSYSTSADRPRIGRATPTTRVVTGSASPTTPLHSSGTDQRDTYSLPTAGCCLGPAATLSPSVAHATAPAGGQTWTTRVPTPTATTPAATRAPPRPRP